MFEIIGGVCYTKLLSPVRLVLRNYRYTGAETRQTFLVCCDSKELLAPTSSGTPVGDQ